MMGNGVENEKSAAGGGEEGERGKQREGETAAGSVRDSLEARPHLAAKVSGMFAEDPTCGGGGTSCTAPPPARGRAARSNARRLHQSGWMDAGCTLRARAGRQVCVSTFLRNSEVLVPKRRTDGASGAA